MPTQVLIVRCSTGTIASFAGFFSLYSGMLTYNVVGEVRGFTVIFKSTVPAMKFVLKQRFVSWAEKFPAIKFEILSSYLE